MVGSVGSVGSVDPDGSGSRPPVSWALAEGPDRDSICDSVFGADVKCVVADSGSTGMAGVTASIFTSPSPSPPAFSNPSAAGSAVDRTAETDVSATSGGPVADTGGGAAMGGPQ